MGHIQAEAGAKFDYWIGLNDEVQRASRIAWASINLIHWDGRKGMSAPVVLGIAAIGAVGSDIPRANVGLLGSDCFDHRPAVADG